MPRTTTTDPQRFWIAVVASEHVARGIAGGFVMFAHGRHSAVKRVQPGDWLAYYSPRERMGAGDAVRAFTAIARIDDRDPYEAEMGAGRVGWRRDATYAAKAKRADVYPLLDQVSFIADREHWGLAFHRSLFAVPRADFALIAAAMGLDPDRL